MNDPKKYRELCQPFEDTESANAALNAFQQELYELRVKHRIRDVTVCMAVDIADPDREGGEWVARAAAHIGSSRNFVELAAFALGEARAAEEQFAKAVEALGKATGRGRK